MGFEETLQLPLKVISPLKVQGTFSLKKNTPCTGGVGDKNLQDTCLSCLMSTLYVEKGDRDHAKKTEALQWCVCAVVVEKSTTPPLPLISHTSPRVVQYCQQYSIGKKQKFYLTASFYLANTDFLDHPKCRASIRHLVSDT